MTLFLSPPRQQSFALLLIIFVLQGCGGGGSGSNPSAPVAAPDQTAPVITLNGNTALQIAGDETYEELGATAQDSVDGQVDVEISGVVGNNSGTYEVTYSATDAAGNRSEVTRTVERLEMPDDSQTLVVLEQALAGPAWDLGFNAYDEGIEFNTCENDGGDGCPNITWGTATDSQRGAVLEIIHSNAGQNAGFFIKTSQPLDLRAYAGGTLQFDVKVLSGDSRFAMKVDCVFPCSSGTVDLGDLAPGDENGWTSVSVEVNTLVAQDLELSQVDTGIVIWAANFTSTRFLLDNVRWVANPEGPITDTPSGGGSDFVNPGYGGYESPLTYDNFELVWSDEFTDTVINQQDWNFEIGRGSGGWGNNELQYYQRDNTTLLDGLLVIEARQEDFSGAQYTSSRLTTQDKFEFRYGRVDVRAALPRGQGLWPALWMLGANFPEIGWPMSGEIDIMEMIGGAGRENTVYGTAHWNNGGPSAAYAPVNFGSPTQSPAGEPNFSQRFHVFSILWSANEITWLVDNEAYHTMALDNSVDLAPLREQFFLIFNVAVGGNWPGSPNSNTQFPQRMLVDYVRVFQSAP